jgi:hypothetical protein
MPQYGQVMFCNGLPRRTESGILGVFMKVSSETNIKIKRGLRYRQYL